MRNTDMQLNSTADLATKLAARVYGGSDGPAAASAERTAQANADRGAGFASLLRASQSIVAPAAAPIAAPAPPRPQPVAAPPVAHPAQASTAPSRTDPDEDAAPPATAAGATAEAPPPPAAGEPTDATLQPPPRADVARTLLRARLRAADGGGAAKAAKPVETDADAAPTDKPASTDEVKAKAPTDAPAAAAAGLPVALPNPPLPAPVGPRADAPGTVVAADPTRGEPRAVDPPAARPGAPAGDLAATATATAPATATIDPGTAIAPGAAFAAVLANTRREVAEAPPRSTAVDAAGAAAPTAGAFATAPAAGTAAAQPVDVPTPVGSPDFAQHLGVQVSVLAKDGVQHAELHLNPADMGPVSVQITLDGTQARIDFGADVAATRHAIEAGLPQLAGALADAGFTLAGGGVSQHAGSGRGDGSGDAPASGGEGRGGRVPGVDADAGAARAVGRRSVRIGGLDLYA